jgi:DNA-binding GntR family transcriptional regulator
VPREPVLPAQRVVDDIRGKITAGELVPGDHLASVAMMGADYGVSRTTVLKALGILRDEGLIYTVPRWGSFVAERK